MPAVFGEQPSRSAQTLTLAIRPACVVDVREHYEDGGVLKPGKKGMAMPIPQWEKLQRLMPEMEDEIRTQMG